MDLAVTVPPLASTGRRVDQVSGIGTNTHVEDLTRARVFVVPSIGLASRAVKARLVALLC